MRLPNALEDIHMSGPFCQALQYGFLSSSHLRMSSGGQSREYRMFVVVDL